jgi:sorbitol-specific phosphotransferase system component IIA
VQPDSGSEDTNVTRREDRRYRALVVSVGPEVPALLDAGMVITFREGSPPELAEMSAIQRVEDVGESAVLELQGEVRWLLPDGALATRLRIVEVGARAEANLRQLGHVVFVTSDDPLLPGQVRLAGTLPRRLQPGAVLEIWASARGDRSEHETAPRS